MPYFHATWADRLPSVLARGLGGLADAPKNWDCEDGVYLAESAVVAVGMLVDYLLERMPDGASPRDLVASIRVLVVDDARIDPSRLRPDPHCDLPGLWLYGGTIDVTNAVVLDADAALAGSRADGDPAP